MNKPRQRAEKWEVYGEFGDRFTNLADAKKCAKESSKLGGDGEVYLIENGCWYFQYENGKLVYDGWRKRVAK